MKRSNTWFALILIVSASLLSAASGGSGATPSDQPQANEVEQATSNPHGDATQAATVSEPRGRNSASAQSGSYTYNYYYPAPDSWLAFFGQIAAIVSAILLTFFTGGLWITSIWQWRIAHTALNTERPFLFVTSIRCPHGLNLDGRSAEVR